LGEREAGAQTGKFDAFVRTIDSMRGDLDSLQQPLPAIRSVPYFDAGAKRSDSSCGCLAACGNSTFRESSGPQGGHRFIACAFSMVVESPVGSNCQIEVSSDLAHWLPLTNFVACNSATYFSDVQSANVGQRFYRAKLP